MSGGASRRGAAQASNRPAGTSSRNTRSASQTSQAQGGGPTNKGGSAAQQHRASLGGAANPTAASLARNVSAPNTPAAPFGSDEPRAAAYSRFRALTDTARRRATVEEVLDQEQHLSGVGAAHAAATPPSNSPHNTPLPSSTAVTEAELSPMSTLSASVHSSREGGGGRASAESRSLRPAVSAPGSRDSAASVPHSQLSGSSARSLQGSNPRRRDLPPHLRNESVTAALVRRRGSSTAAEYKRLFQGPGRVIEIYDEPLFASVDRYHDSPEPEEYDPLLRFGAVDGILPDTDDASTMKLRDVLIRYERPHLSFEWESLPQAISVLIQLPADSVVVSRAIDALTGQETYSLNLLNLASMAHAVLAMRLTRADNHIRSYLARIQGTLTGNSPDERISSVDSTISEVWEAYGRVPPARELYRMIARTDYGQRAAIIDPTAYQSAMDSLHIVETPNPRPYKPRERGAVPTMREAETELWAAAPNASAYSGSLPAVRFADAPPATPDYRPVTISALPGAGFIQQPGHAASQASAAGGPSMMRRKGVVDTGGVPSLFSARFAPLPPTITTHAADPTRTSYTYRCQRKQSARRALRRERT
ncbi:hypothetical protein C8R43DRAFT_947647 [Mycena crocata]|nr:hypothetical protein C8R43DRAFT_947647 [Mycena crocata]